MELNEIKTKLKELIVREMNLEEIAPGDIADDQPLFGEGLGLDSLDAVELVVLLEKNFGVKVQDMEEGRAAFTSIDSLAAYVRERLPA